MDVELRQEYSEQDIRWEWAGVAKVTIALLAALAGFWLIGFGLASLLDYAG